MVFIDNDHVPCNLQIERLLQMTEEALFFIRAHDAPAIN